MTPLRHWTGALVVVLMGALSAPHAVGAQDAPARTELDAGRFVRMADDVAPDRRRERLMMAIELQGACPDPSEPCNCTFEGFQAPCDFVLACLANGLCVPDTPSTSGLLREAAKGGRFVLEIVPGSTQTTATCDVTPSQDGTDDGLGPCDTLAQACKDLGGMGQCGGPSNPDGCECVY